MAYDAINLLRKDIKKIQTQKTDLINEETYLNNVITSFGNLSMINSFSDIQKNNLMSNFYNLWKTENSYFVSNNLTLTFHADSLINHFANFDWINNFTNFQSLIIAKKIDTAQTYQYEFYVLKTQDLLNQIIDFTNLKLMSEITINTKDEPLFLDSLKAFGFKNKTTNDMLKQEFNSIYDYYKAFMNQNLNNEINGTFNIIYHEKTQELMLNLDYELSDKVKKVINQNDIDTFLNAMSYHLINDKNKNFLKIKPTHTGLVLNYVISTSDKLGVVEPKLFTKLYLKYLTNLYKFNLMFFDYANNDYNKFSYDANITYFAFNEIPTTLNHQTNNTASNQESLNDKTNAVNNNMAQPALNNVNNNINQPLNNTNPTLNQPLNNVNINNVSINKQTPSTYQTQNELTNNLQQAINNYQSQNLQPTNPIPLKKTIKPTENDMGYEDVNFNQQLNSFNDSNFNVDNTNQTAFANNLDESSLSDDIDDLDKSVID